MIRFFHKAAREEIVAMERENVFDAIRVRLAEALSRWTLFSLWNLVSF